MTTGPLFARTLRAIGAGRGSYERAAAFAQRRGWHASAEFLQKAAVSALSTGSASAIVIAGNTEFMGLVMPRTILGKLGAFGIRKVQFYEGVVVAMSDLTMAWVPEGGAFPVGKLGFQGGSLPSRKGGGITVLTEEMINSAAPNADQVIERQLRDDLTRFHDVALTDPNAAPVADLSPGSLTYGASSFTASGTDAAAARADVIRVVSDLADSMGTLEGAVLIVGDGNAFALASAVNAAGSPLFPNLTVAGGTIYGIPAIVSSSVGDQIIAAHAPSIKLADDGVMTVAVGEHATLEMKTDPTNNSVTPTGTDMVSLWMTNSVALRVTRFVNWEAGAGAVHVVSGARYGASEQS